MKKTLTLFVFFLLAFYLPKVNAQVTPPPGAPIQTSITVVSGLTVSEEILLSGNVINDFGGDAKVKLEKNPIGLAEKSGFDNENKFIAYYSDGTYDIYSVTPISRGKDEITKIGSGKTDSISVSSGNVSKIRGDDLYAIYGGALAIKRTSMAHWGWDTVGMPNFGYVTDFDLDTSQNVYVINSAGLLYQPATGYGWAKVTAYPGVNSTSIMVDKQNRIAISTYSKVYVGTNNGTAWDSIALTGQTGRIGQDAFGNLYTTTGHYAYRLSYSGGAWTSTRIDTGITNHAADTTVTIINSINGDTLIYAATAFGLWVSADQGNTWTISNQGINSAPAGFWLFNNGRMVANTGLGTFIKNATDTIWTQTFPTGGKYLSMGAIQGDTLGNIYTVLSWNSGQQNMPMKSTDQGATWQPDTAGVAQIPYINYHAYYVDEYGSSHVSGGANGQLLLYSKAPTGSYTLDTAGIGTQMPNFGDILTQCSDHNGYLYMSGHNFNNLSIWRRPVAGGSWLPDTAGVGAVYLTASNYDSHHGVIGLNWYGWVGLYHRGATGWTKMGYPTTVYSFSTPSGIAGNPGGSLISSFYTSNFTTGTVAPYGIYCTTDVGHTWTYVPGLDSTYVNSAETFGDTTYLLTTIGIYKMTCAGTLVDSVPSGIRSIADDGIKLYPNPTSGECHISMDASLADGSVLIIQDLMGRMVKTVTLSGNETTFQTNDMNAGMYICTISAGGKVISTKKLVVE